MIVGDSKAELQEEVDRLRRQCSAMTSVEEPAAQVTDNVSELLSTWPRGPVHSTSSDAQFHPNDFWYRSPSKAQPSPTQPSLTSPDVDSQTGQSHMQTEPDECQPGPAHSYAAEPTTASRHVGSRLAGSDTLPRSLARVEANARRIDDCFAL